MQTVIATRHAVGQAALGRSQPGTGPDLAGREDFATRMAAEAADKSATEDLVRSEATAASGLVAAAFWSGAPMVAGREGTWSASSGHLQPDEALSPARVASSTPDLELAAVGAAGPTGMLSSGSVPLDVDAAMMSSVAQAWTKGSPPRQDIGLDVAPFPSTEGLMALPLSGETEMAAQGSLADTDLAVAVSDDARGWISMSGAGPQAAVVASTGLQLRSEPLPPKDGPAIGKHDLAAPLGAASLTGSEPILTAPNSTAIAAIAPPAVFVAKLAETALLSLFAAQADAASLDPSEGVVGLAPVGMPSAFASASLVSGPVAVPQLAAQLVHSLAHNGEGTTEIALSPDELGHVRVTLQADPQNPDRLMVMLHFERPETLDLFRRHADQLAEALRDAGFAGADIGFGHSGSGGNSDPRSEGALADQSPPTPERASGLTPGLTPDQPNLRLASSSALDLRL